MADDIVSPSGDIGGSGNAPSASPSTPAVSSSDAGSAIASPETSAAQTPDKGPVPYDRFAEINTKYGQLRWAEQYQPEQVQQSVQLLRWLDKDPEGAYGYIGNLLRQQGLLRSAQAEQRETRPEADVFDPATGRKFYSAEAAERLLQWELGQKLGPIEQQLQQQEAERVDQRAQAHARAQLTEAESWPYFKDHAQDILKAMDGDKRLSLEGAYNRVVLPKLRTLERQSIVAEMNQKGRATTVDPGAGAGASSVPLHKLPIATLLKREMAKRGGSL